MRICVSNGLSGTLFAVSVIAVAAASLVAQVHAQQATAKEPLVFEVASIKPTAPDERRAGSCINRPEASLMRLSARR